MADRNSETFLYPPINKKLPKHSGILFSGHSVPLYYNKCKLVDRFSLQKSKTGHIMAML